MPARRIVTVAATLLLIASQSDAAPPAPNPVIPISLDQYVRTTVTTELDALEKGADFAEAIPRLDALFDQVIAAGSDKTLDAFRDAAFARRLIHQLNDIPADKRIDTLKFLRANDALARTLAFMIETTASQGHNFQGRSRGTTAAGPYAVLDQLREKHADTLDKYANLTAAICVVHDRPLNRHINENSATAVAPADIYDYFTTNEKKMLFGLKLVPAELLVYVVDTTDSIDDMTWALKKYAGDPAIGKRFFDITYDYDNFRTGRPKGVTEAGFTLPNILKYGGVCADQAYFASEIGKAIGVPTAYARASSGAVGHAWVGFLQAKGDKGAWNFDVGRYDDYRGIKGEVTDPQTRQTIPDSYVSLLAELIGRKPADRQNTVALADAALRLSGLDPSAPDFARTPITAKLSGARTPARAAGTDATLELLELALKQNPGNPRAWLIVRDLAQAGKLSPLQKMKWSSAIMKLCGDKYPDFAAALLDPMIAAVEDPMQQIQLWDAAFTQFQSRMDLGADIRMHQAKLWESQNNTAKAGKCYEEVIERYANSGPFVLAAVVACERLLEPKGDKVLKLYEQTWAKTQRPQDMAGQFMRQSNWFKIGSMYAAKLKDAGQSAKAQTVLTQLGVKDAAP